MGLFWTDYQDINNYFEYRDSPYLPDMPDNYWSESDWLSAPLEWVSFDNLYARQDWYHPDVMEHTTYGVGFVVVTLSQGNYIWDGHHTAIQAKANNESGFTAHVKRPETDNYA